MKKVLMLSLSILFLASCTKDDSMTFEKNRVGKLHGRMTVEQVRHALQDKKLSELKKVSGIVIQNQMEVSDEEGKQELILIFQPENDTLKLYAVEIISPEFKSTLGVSKTDTFEKWKQHHKIRKAERTLRHFVVFVDDLNATLEFTDEDLVSQAQNRTLINPDPDWVKKDARTKRLILFFSR